MGTSVQPQFEEMAVSVDAAVRCLVRGKAGKERELWRALGEARQRLSAPGSSPGYYQAIFALAHSASGADFDPLLPFLQSCDDLWPFSETVGPYEPPTHPAVEATEELLRLAVAEGAMHEYFRPQPAVEQWIARVAERVREVLRDSLTARSEREDGLFPRLLGTAVALRDLLGGLTPYFQRVADRSRQELSLVAHVIGDLRRARSRARLPK